jgi:hypothetical protein
LYCGTVLRNSSVVLRAVMRTAAEAVSYCGTVLTAGGVLYCGTVWRTTARGSVVLRDSIENYSTGSLVLRDSIEK